MTNHYLEILELKPGASEEDIKNSYRRLAKKYHPDASKSEQTKEQFLAVTEAYRFLTVAGPKLNQQDIAYDYDPMEQQYEELRQKARAYAYQKAREESENQQQSLKKIYKIFNFINGILLLLNALILMDYFLEPRTHTENILSVSEIHVRTDNDIEHVADNVVLENYQFRVEAGEGSGMDNKQAIVYSSPIFNKLQHVEVNVGAKDLEIVPQTSSFMAFFFLVPLAFIFGIIYYFLDLRHPNKITLVVLSFIIFAVEIFILVR